jgi:hypothetical protein
MQEVTTHYRAQHSGGTVTRCRNPMHHEKEDT